MHGSMISIHGIGVHGLTSRTAALRSMPQTSAYSAITTAATPSTTTTITIKQQPSHLKHPIPCDSTQMYRYQADEIKEDVGELLADMDFLRFTVFEYNGSTRMINQY